MLIVCVFETGLAMLTKVASELLATLPLSLWCWWHMLTPHLTGVPPPKTDQCFCCYVYTVRAVSLFTADGHLDCVCLLETVDGTFMAAWEELLFFFFF